MVAGIKVNFNFFWGGDSYLHMRKNQGIESTNKLGNDRLFPKLKTYILEALAIYRESF